MMTTLTSDFIRGVTDGTFSATGRPYQLPDNPSDDYSIGWLRGCASARLNQDLKTSATASTIQTEPQPVHTTPANQMIGERFILPAATTETNPLLTTVCDRCGASLDCSGEPFLRTFNERSLGVCGSCGGSLEILLIDDKLITFKD